MKDCNVNGSGNNRLWAEPLPLLSLKTIGQTQHVAAKKDVIVLLSLFSLPLIFASMGVMGMRLYSSLGEYAQTVTVEPKVAACSI